MLATDDMALSYSQQLAILLSNINHALIHLDGGSTTITYVRANARFNITMRFL